jgi:hypothetical protein
VMIIFGGLTAIMSPLNIAFYIAGWESLPSRASSPTSYVAGLVVMTIVGGAAIWSGRLWWRQQWRWAIVCTLATYALGVLASSLAYSDSL